MAKAREAGVPPANPLKGKITIERRYRASLKDLWELWTTKRGFESWWGPGGFTAKVQKLDLRPGGELVYAMTASDPQQIEFMKQVGMPLTIPGKITFTEIVPNKRLAYAHLADFIPGVKPYDVATKVEFQSDGEHARMILTIDAMHSDEWTQRAQMGWESQLSKLTTMFGG